MAILHNRVEVTRTFSAGSYLVYSCWFTITGGRNVNKWKQEISVLHGWKLELYITWSILQKPRYLVHILQSYQLFVIW